MTSAPTVRRRRVAAELRRHRELAGLTLDQAADEAGVSRSALSRAENAQVPMQPPVVHTLMQIYGADPADTAALVRLAKDAKRRGWWQAFSDVLSNEYADYIGLENEARGIRTYEPQFVPGLLQSPDYAREIIRSVLITATDDGVERMVKVREQRQERLASLDYWAIIDESALRRPTGESHVMVDQVNRLIEAARLPNVTLQVLPGTVGAHPGMLGSFSILEFAELPDVTYVEGVFGELFVEDPDEVRRHNVVYNHLRSKALDQDQSVKLLRELRENL